MIVMNNEIISRDIPSCTWLIFTQFMLSSNHFQTSLVVTLVSGKRSRKWIRWIGGGRGGGKEEVEEGEGEVNDDAKIKRSFNATV